MRHAAAVVCFLGLVAARSLGDLAVAIRGAYTLPATATDQNNQAVTVNGLSGITRVAGDIYALVMEEGAVINTTITIDANGVITAASYTGAVTPSAALAGEDLCPRDASMGGGWFITDGITLKGVTTAGTVSNGPTVPTIYTNAVAGHKIDSLCKSIDGTHLWFCNEEALSVDGPLSTSSAGSRVRLQRMNRSGPNYVAGVQYGVITQPLHGPPITNSRSGVVALAELPGGQLIALEHSYATSGSGTSLSRMYLLNYSAATDVSGYSNLDGTPPWTAVVKDPLYSGNLYGLEGLCVGPTLGDGSVVLVGVVDNGWPGGFNRLVAFRVAGLGCGPADVGGQGGTTGPDAALDNNDFVVFINAFFGGNAAADVGGQGGIGGSDGNFDNNDFVVFINLFFAGC